VACSNHAGSAKYFIMNNYINITSVRRVTIIASLGSALEYYDFVVFGLMANYLSAIFFPHQEADGAVFKSFLVFAVGYFARPIGGSVIGWIGDKFGRRPAFLISTGLMTLSTLCLAFLPISQLFLPLST